MSVKKKDSNKSNGEIVLRLRKEDILTIVFIISIIITVVCGVKAYIRSEESRKLYENYMQNEANSSYSIYANDEMGFTINYPKTWGYEELDRKLSKAILDTVTKDAPFNMYTIKIPTEMAPVVFANQSDSGTLSSFMSLSIRGSNVNSDRLDELVPLLTDELSALILSDAGDATAEDAENTYIPADDLSVISAEVRGSQIYIQIKTKYKEQELYYTSVATIVGKNLVQLILGSATGDSQDVLQLSSLLNSFKCASKVVGKIDNESDVVGSGLLAPQTLPDEYIKVLQEFYDSDGAELQLEGHVESLTGDAVGEISSWHNHEGTSHDGE